MENHISLKQPLSFYLNPRRCDKIIPHNFYIYKTKEEKDLIAFLNEKEYWHNKRNALYNLLGITQLKTFKPVNNNSSLGNVTHETQELFDNVDKQIAKLKSCSIGKCEI